MQQQTLQFYQSLFNSEEEHSDDFYKTIYSTLVHSEGLKSALIANLSLSRSDDELALLDNEIQVRLFTLFNKGVGILNNMVGYPAHASIDSQNQPFEEDDITDIKPTDKSSTLVLDVNFKNIDEELRLEIAYNILKIYRVIFSSIYETGNLLTLGVSDKIQYNELFKTVHWFLDGLMPNLDLEKVNHIVLRIIKEIIFLLYDYLHVITSVGAEYLDEFRKYGFVELLNEVLHKTHVKYEDGKPSVLPPVKLSVDSSIRIFAVIGMLNNNNLIKLNCTSDDEFKLFENQFLPILREALRASYQYSPDIIGYQVMNQSFFNWMTANLFNFSDEYLNDKTITATKSTNKELEEIFDKRTKQNRQLEDDHLDVFEFLPITLYIQSFGNKEFYTKFLTSELGYVWLCLSSYILTYQFRSKKLTISTRLILLIFDQISKLDQLDELTIDEFKWKLCRQKLPIIPLNKDKNRLKALSSYLLDNLSAFIRFNLHKKLNVDNFTTSIKLMGNILSNTIDENYHYEELFKSVANLMNFNIIHIQNPDIQKEILVLFEIGLNTPVKDSLIYHILHIFNKIDKVDLNEFPNTKSLFEFIRNNFDIYGDDKSKIQLLDLDFDSPELHQYITQYNSPGIQMLPTPVKIHVNEIILNVPEK